MRSRMSWIVTGLLVGTLFLCISLRQVDLLHSLHIVLRAEWGYAIAAVAASIVFMIVKTWRWCILLQPLHQFQVRQLLAAVYAGTAVNLIVSHVGELARVAIVGRRYPVPASALLGTVAVERLFDTAAVLVFLGVLLVASEEVAPIVMSASYVAAALVAIALGMLLVVMIWPVRVLRMAERALGFLDVRWRVKLMWHLGKVLDGLAVIRSGRLLIQVAMLSMLQWLCILAGILASMHALQVEAASVAAIAVLVLLVVGLTLPTAPVHIGTTQLGFTAGLAAFEVTAQSAFAASIVYTVFVLLPMSILGLAALYGSSRPWRTGLPRLPRRRAPVG